MQVWSLGHEDPQEKETVIHSIVLAWRIPWTEEPGGLQSLKEFRFKGLDLVDRVPDELWTEVCNIVQETEIKTIPMEKKGKKAKWLSEETLQIRIFST